MKRLYTLFLFAFSLSQLCAQVDATEKSLTLRVQPAFNNQKLILGSQHYITSNNDSVTIARLRFYISGIAIHFTDNSVYTEANSYHLIDAEDESTLSLTLKNVPEKKISSIEFNIGIDSLESVSGALDGDLDPVKGMYWAWNSGYINAKLEGNYYHMAEEKEFEFHVGGYLAPYKALRKIELNCPSSDSIIIIADVAAWFSNIQLANKNRIVMPGAEAMELADQYTKMLRIEK